MKRTIEIGSARAVPGTIGKGYLKMGAMALIPEVTTPVLIINGRQDGPVLWLNGAVHGDEIKKGETLFTIHQGNKSIRIKSHINGVVERVNSDVVSNPALLSEDSLNNSWAVEVKPRNIINDIGNLFLSEKANNWMKNELTRLRDFLNQNQPAEGLLATSQDGGIPVEGIMENYDRDLWLQFEKEFLASSK